MEATSMTRAIVRLALLSLLLPAQVLAEGINLSWDDCGFNGLANKVFACNNNVGAPFTMIGSFIPPAGINEYIGMEAVLTVQSSTSTLPDWWRHGLGQCRGSTALNTIFD